MKKTFFTGLVILLPLAITLMIVTFLINLLTKPFLGLVSLIFDYYGILNQPFLFLSGDQVLLWSSKLIILIGFVVIATLVGILGQFLFVRYIGHLGNRIMHRIPLFSRVYKAIQDVMHSLFGEKAETRFSTVVLVPFPYAGMYTLGLVTKGNLPEDSTAMDATKLLSVFVPGTPNPTMGFMLVFQREQLIPLNIRVEDALKFLMSCGVVSPAFSIRSEEELPQDLAGK